MTKLLHWIAHKLRWNYGRVHTELRGNDVWVGFKCDGCGEIEGFHKAMDRITNTTRGNA